MTREESIIWLESLKTAIGQHQYRNLWNFEQPLSEIIELLQSDRLIELPCKIGDELFLADYPENHYRLKRYEFFDERVVMVIECFKIHVVKRFVDEHFGKTVFLTREGAEKAMLNNKEKESDR